MLILSNSYDFVLFFMKIMKSLKIALFPPRSLVWLEIHRSLLKHQSFDCGHHDNDSKGGMFYPPFGVES